MRKLSGSMKRDAVFVQHAASVIAFSGVVINYSVCLLWTMVLSHASLISKEVLYVERVFIVVTDDFKISKLDRFRFDFLKKI